MKKIWLFMLFISVLALWACSNQNDVKKNKENTQSTQVSKEVSKNTVNNKWNNQTLQQKVKNNTENNTQTKQVDNETNIQNQQKQVEEIKKEYSEKLNKLANLWWTDELSKLEVLANANCPGVCNLDMKNQLTKEELKVAQACEKLCIEKQTQAKAKLKQYQAKLNQEKQAYPEKCFQDAEKNYEQQQKMLKNNKQPLPKWFKQPSKQEIVQLDANRCILIYGWTNYDCNKIKKYKQPYERCKRLRQLQGDLEFIQNWKYKTFDDYLQNKNWF